MEEKENSTQGRISLEAQANTDTPKTEEKSQGEELQKSPQTNKLNGFKGVLERLSLTLNSISLSSLSDHLDITRRILINLILLGFILFVVSIAFTEFNKHVVVVMDFDVPQEFQDQGYTGQVLANKLVGQMSYIEEKARLPKDPQNPEVAAISSDPTVQRILVDSVYSSANPNPIDEVVVPDVSLSLGSIVQTLRIRRPSPRISGEVVLSDKQDPEPSYRLSIRMMGKPTESFPVMMSDLDKMDETIVRKAAEYIYRYISPFTLAAYLYSEERIKDSEEIIRSFCLNHPPIDDDYLAYNLWGVILSDQEKYDQAIVMFEEALKRDRHAAVVAYTGWGTALHSQGKYEEAIDKYRAATNNDTGNTPRSIAITYNNWGMAEAEQKRNTNAIEKFEKAIKADPTSTIAYNNWGWVLGKVGKDDEAIEKLKMAIVLSPRYPLAYYNLGRAYISKSDQVEMTAEKLNYSKEAIVSFQHAVKYSACDSNVSRWARIYLYQNSNRDRTYFYTNSSTDEFDCEKLKAKLE